MWFYSCNNCNFLCLWWKHTQMNSPKMREIQKLLTEYSVNVEPPWEANWYGIIWMSAFISLMPETFSLSNFWQLLKSFSRTWRKASECLWSTLCKYLKTLVFSFHPAQFFTFTDGISSAIFARIVALKKLHVPKKCAKCANVQFQRYRQISTL